MAAGRSANANLAGAMRFIQRECNLHQRCAAGIALDLEPLDQEGERIVLMIQRVQHRGTDSPQQHAEGGVAGQVGAGAAC